MTKTYKALSMIEQAELQQRVAELELMLGAQKEAWCTAYDIGVTCKHELAALKEAIRQDERCPTCGEDEPHTGTCGTSDSDTRALCKRKEVIKIQGERSQQVASEPVAWRWKHERGAVSAFKPEEKDAINWEPLYTQGCATSCLQAPTIPAAREHKRFASEYEEGVTVGWNDCLDEMLSATPKESQQASHWDEKRMDIIGQNGNDGIHYLGDHYAED